MDGSGAADKARQVVGRLAKEAGKQLVRQGLRWLLATIGPVGVLVVVALLAVIGLFYGLPAAAHGTGADPASHAQKSLWQQSQAAAVAAMPPIQSVDQAEKNWPVDPGWLAALATLAQSAGPVDLAAWATALAPRFAYRTNTVTTTTVREVTSGHKTRTERTVTTRQVLLLTKADTATGTAVRTYRWVDDTTVEPGGATVTVHHEVPVSTSWTEDTSRIAALLVSVLRQPATADAVSAYLTLAAGWDNPQAGLVGLLGPPLGGAGAAAPPSGNVRQNVLRWQRLIGAAARVAGIRGVALVDAVVAAESGGNPYAVSSAGAQGLMQLMPATAAALGVYDLFDPASNLRAGTEHLAWLLNEYGFGSTCWPPRGGSVSAECTLPLERAIAAYNAGEGPVDQYGGVPPYPETQRYVQTVLGYYAGFRASTVR